MSSGLGLSAAGTPSSGSLEELLAQKLKFESALKGGAGWFVWVAGLSMVNSILALSKSNFQFIFGLGIAQLFDELAKRGGPAGAVIGLLINALVAGGFVVCWRVARKGSKPAFLAGMIVYGLDALLMLAAGAWLALAFHVFALVGMSAGLNAISKLRAAEAEIARLRPMEPGNPVQSPEGTLP